MRIRTRCRTESVSAESSTTKPRQDHMTAKRAIRLASFTIAVVFVLGMASRTPVGFAQHVDDPGGCSVQTLEGDYLATGRSDSRDDAPRGTFPHVLVGVHSFNGAGTFLLRSTISRGRRDCTRNGTGGVQLGYRLHRYTGLQTGQRRRRRALRYRRHARRRRGRIRADRSGDDRNACHQEDFERSSPTAVAIWPSWAKCRAE